VRVMRDLEDPYMSFYGVAWSPDGKLLACGDYRREVQVWEGERERHPPLDCPPTASRSAPGDLES